MTSHRGEGGATGQLWQHWISLMLHELGTPFSTANGYARLLREHPEFVETRRVEMFSEQEKALRRMADLFGMISTCSRGRNTQLGHVFSNLEQLYGETLTVRRTGDLTLPPPTDHLGILLSLLVSSAHGSFRPVVIEVTVTDAGGHIKIAPNEATAAATWEPIMIPDVRTWWFGEALESLIAHNYCVEAYHNGRLWYIVVAWTSRLSTT